MFFLHFFEHAKTISFYKQTFSIKRVIHSNEAHIVDCSLTRIQNEGTDDAKTEILISPSVCMSSTFYELVPTVPNLERFRPIHIFLPYLSCTTCPPRIREYLQPSAFYGQCRRSRRTDADVLPTEKLLSRFITYPEQTQLLEGEIPPKSLYTLNALMNGFNHPSLIQQFIYTHTPSLSISLSLSLSVCLSPSCWCLFLPLSL